MKDVNKTTHSGVAVTNPTMTTLGKKTPMAIFTLKVREMWIDYKGHPAHRDNLFKVEALKSNAYWVKTNVKAGKRFMIDGNLRYDIINGVQDVKIRVLHIEEITSEDFKRGKEEGMRQALERSLNIIKSSKGTETAIAKLEVLLDEI